MVILQIVRIRAAFAERKIRSDKYARKLKDRHGFDKAPTSIYGQDEFVRNKLSNRFRNEEQQARVVKIDMDVNGRSESKRNSLFFGFAFYFLLVWENVHIRVAFSLNYYKCIYSSHIPKFYYIFRTNF